MPMNSQRQGHTPGLVAGVALAPATAIGSYVRRARVFHPRGTVLWGSVLPVAGNGSLHDAGARLAGAVLVRFSGAWWKTRQWPDVLGCALRFTHASAPSVTPLAGDQDLLLATVRVPITTLLAPLSTRVDDYLRNRYFGVSPFVFPPLGRIKLRLSPVHSAPHPGSRHERLLDALRAKPIELQLEARSAHVGSRYAPIARLVLTEHVSLDQETLSFDPFRSGRQLMPTGFVHGLRIASYAASRRARAAAGAR
jgi:hypothetical protein